MAPPFMWRDNGLRCRVPIPAPGEIMISDIARSLSLTNRWCGTTGRDSHGWSVAEHSLLVSKSCPVGLERAGLLHDAAEAYLGDLTAPIKAYCPDYLALEKRLNHILATKYGLMANGTTNTMDCAGVRQADRLVCLAEARDLMGIPPEGLLEHWVPGEVAAAAKIVIGPARNPRDAEAAFLQRFMSLSRSHKCMMPGCPEPVAFSRQRYCSSKCALGADQNDHAWWRPRIAAGLMMLIAKKKHVNRDSLRAVGVKCATSWIVMAETLGVIRWEGRRKGGRWEIVK